VDREADHKNKAFPGYTAWASCTPTLFPRLAPQTVAAEVGEPR